MIIQIRPMRQEDVERCGRICHAAFRDIAERHNFRPDFPTPEAGIEITQGFYASPDVFSVVAERDGEVIGSNHLWEYDAIRAVGPITIDPQAQAKGAGRMLMEAVLSVGNRVLKTNQPLVSAWSRMRSMELRCRSTRHSALTSGEPLALMEGELHGDVPPDVTVRAIEEEDYARCAELCREVHGLDHLVCRHSRWTHRGVCIGAAVLGVESCRSRNRERHARRVNGRQQLVARSARLVPAANASKQSVPVVLAEWIKSAENNEPHDDG